MSNTPLQISLKGTTHLFDLDDPALPSWIKDAAMESGNYPYTEKLKKNDYEAQLHDLQRELVKVQNWQQTTGERVMILFEGRDAAGKGGTIKVLSQYMNPRHVNIVALPKPNDRERDEWYYQRYIKHFPTAGEMVVFDRSWYNRAGVEPVMGFCSSDQHQAFLHETPRFEKMIVREGIHFFKFWLNVGQEMQLKRFHDRRHDPLKSWKISPIDLKAMAKWVDYTKVRDQMMTQTHSDEAPWTIVRSNDKRRARLNAIRHILNALDYTDKNKKRIGKTDPLILSQGADLLQAK